MLIKVDIPNIKSDSYLSGVTDVVEFLSRVAENENDADRKLYLQGIVREISSQVLKNNRESLLEKLEAKLNEKVIE